MKDLRRIQVKAAVLLSTLCLFLSGCGGTALLFSELTTQEIQTWETGEFLEQTEELLGLSAMRRVAQSGGKTLYYNDKTTEIAVETEDGTVWYSNPQDRLSLDASALGRYSSPLLVYVIDSTETTKPMNTMDDCVAYGQAKAESIENGIRVTYHFGKVTKRPLYPQALTAERFQEILDSLDETERNNMKRYYTEVNYRAVTEPQDLKKLKELYAKIEEVEKLYSLKPALSA